MGARHKGWDEKQPIGFYTGYKKDLKLVDRDQRHYGYWNLYEADKNGQKEYFVELILPK